MYVCSVHLKYSHRNYWEYEEEDLSAGKAQIEDMDQPLIMNNLNKKESGVGRETVNKQKAYFQAR